MPLYDFECAEGHVTEALTDREAKALDCDVCRAPAQRVVVYPGHTPGVTGVTVPPMRERRVRLTRFAEAQGEMVHEAERTGVAAPDVLGIAKRRAADIQKYRPDLLGEPA